jgi:hypothetical protein
VPPLAAGGPGPTVMAMTFEPLAPLELLEVLELPVPPELLLLELLLELLLLELLLLELLVELLELGVLPALLPPPPPPQLATTHRPSNRVQRKRWRMRWPGY